MIFLVLSILLSVGNYWLVNPGIAHFVSLFTYRCRVRVAHVSRRIPNTKLNYVSTVHLSAIGKGKGLNRCRGDLYTIVQQINLHHADVIGSQDLHWLVSVLSIWDLKPVVRVLNPGLRWFGIW